MLIDCPNCSFTYHISGASLGQIGRKMRCAACHEVWRAPPHIQTDPEFDDIRLKRMDVADESGLEINAIATSDCAAPPSYDEIYGQTSRPAVVVANRAPWKIPRVPVELLLSIAAIAASMGLIAKREAVVATVPATAKLYSALGVPVNLRGLEFRRVTSVLMGEGAQRVLAVEGDITNISRTSANVPELQLGIKGADGREIYGWTTPAPKARLEMGESVPFRARLAAPPEQARDMIVRFAPEAARTREATNERKTPG